MSLVNNYLKRLGHKSIAPKSKGGGVIPPSLQRMQKESGEIPPGKKFLGFAGIFVLVSCVGYLLISVIPLLLYPAVDESEAVEPDQTPVHHSTAVDVETMEASQKIVKKETLETGSEDKRDITPNAKRPLLPGEVNVVQSSAIDISQTEEEKSTTGVSGKSKEHASENLQPNKIVEHVVDTTVVTGIVEEPRPLSETWETKGDSSRSSTEEQNSPNKIVFKESHNTPDYLYQLGLQAQHSNKYGRAERYYRNVLTEVPDHENSLVNLSAMYIEQQRFQEAQNLLDKVLDINPKNSKALVNLGMIELQQNRKESAADYFLLALQFNPIEETALTNMAYLSQQDKKYEEAGDYFEKLIHISPGKTNILLAYAGLEEKKKKYKSAINLYRQCLDQMSMQENPDRYDQILVRIQTLKQYTFEKAY